MPAIRTGLKMAALAAIGIAAVGWFGGGVNAPVAPPVTPVERVDVPAPPVTTQAPPPAVQPAPVQRASALSAKAVRLYYRAGGSMEWGSACALPGGGYYSVHHVTQNGDKAPPRLGPRGKVTAFNETSDWSFIGVDPKTLNADDFPEIKVGMDLFIHGFVARDRRGQIVPGVAYLDDPNKPFWWLELRDEFTDKFGETIAAEGVLGGFSGSCVLDAQGRLVATTHANGFSVIDGTTNTWAMIIPIRDAIQEAQGKVDFGAAAPVSLLNDPRLPKIEMRALDTRGRLVAID